MCHIASVVILGQLCGAGSMDWNSGPQTSEANNCLGRYLQWNILLIIIIIPQWDPTLGNERTNYHKFSYGFHVAHLCEHTHTVKKWICLKKIILLINIISLYHGKGTQCFVDYNEDLTFVMFNQGDRSFICRFCWDRFWRRFKSFNQIQK